ncbi:MAG TPA: aminopeptidase [Ignavibacteria bacterium]|nr:aminopeptidase [Ignavibacteria bacterium]HQY51654.1 aminopeptidase [Ignavibacteria bacterium]HRA99126.1 aminopeptidase [Ignavibacteria bacterium]
MEKVELQKYCDLIIKVGVNLYEGQCLAIGSGIKNADFALMLADTAYANGAAYVDVIFSSNELTKSRIINSKNIDDINFIPNYPINRSYEQIANDWAFIRIDNLEELNVLKSIDPNTLGIITKNEQTSHKSMSKAISSAKIAWCIVAAPGINWAAKVYDSEPYIELENKLWDSLVKIMRLDKADPVSEWRRHGKNLSERGNMLSKMKIDKLYFTGPDTDLEVGLTKNSIWKGGQVKAQNGREFIPNLPTEEVFTCPDFSRTNGKVKVTKPVKVLENLLTGIWFEFKDGKVINYGADDKRDILEKFFEMDEGASYLGEVALVDINSEVHKSGLIFNSILYDENAACHIALGRGIPMCFSNKDEIITTEDMKKNKCNYSVVHTDFMIGSDKINVKAIDFEGKEIQIIKDGLFTI